MKINKLNINNYGCIKEKNIEFDNGITIIKGDNESGKSTTHQAILASLFGFKNAKNTKSFVLGAKIKSDSGEYPRLNAMCHDKNGNYEASRYFLDKAPHLDIKRDGMVTKYSNAPLEAISNISRNTYEGIYSLDIDQISRLKENWEREQSSILGGLYPDFLLNYNDILNNLDKNIKSTWKGKNPTKAQKAKDEEIKNLRRQLVEANENQEILHKLEIKLEEQKKQLENYKLSIADHENNIKELERINEFYNEIKRLNELSLDLIDIEKYDHLPNDCKAYFNEKQQDLKRENKEISRLLQESKQLRFTQNQFSQNYQMLCSNKSEIEKASQLANSMNICEGEIARIESNREQAQLKFDEIAGRNFTKDYGKEHLDNIKKIDTASASAALKEIKQLEDKKAVNNNNLIELSRININTLKSSLLFLIIIIGQMMIFLSDSQNMITKVLGGIISIGAIAYLIIGRPKGNTASDLKRSNEELDDMIRQRRAKLQSKFMFSFLPVESQNHPDAELINAVYTAQIHLEELDKCNRELKEQKIKMQEIESEITSISSDVLGHSNGFQQDILEMSNRLSEAQKKQKSASDALIAERMLNSQIQKATANRDKLNKQLDTYKKMLSSLQGNDDNERMDLLQNMRKKKIEVETSAKRLKAKYPDYDKLAKGVGSDINKLLSTINLDIENQKEVLDIEKNNQGTLQNENGETKEKLAQLTKSDLQPSIIESRLQDAIEERNERIHKRDTLALTHAIIRNSKELFLKNNKPEFMDIASDYLLVITNERYRKILLSDDGNSIMVENNLGKVLDFEAIEQKVSRGTKEQIFLSLRLAMLNRFDPEDDKLPIILDEALVNWDTPRFQRLMYILNTISAERQVFMFTCHDFLIKNADLAKIKYTKIDI